MIDVTLPGYTKPNLVPLAAVGGLTSDVQIALVPLPRGSITVNVNDEKTKALINDKVQAVSATDSDGVVSSAKRAASGEWQLVDLLPDKYVLSVIATGFGAKTASDVSVTASQTTQVIVSLAGSAPPKAEPEACVITLITANKKPFRVKLCMKVKNINFRGTGLQDLVVATPDRTGLKWLLDWQGWLADEYRDNDIDLAKPTILINPSSLLGGGRFKEGVIIMEENPIFHRSDRATGKQGKELTIGKKTPPSMQGVALFGKVAVPLTVDALDDER